MVGFGTVLAAVVGGSRCRRRWTALGTGGFLVVVSLRVGGSGGGICRSGSFWLLPVKTKSEKVCLVCRRRNART